MKHSGFRPSLLDFFPASIDSCRKDNATLLVLDSFSRPTRNALKKQLTISVISFLSLAFMVGLTFWEVEHVHISFASSFLVCARVNTLLVDFESLGRWLYSLVFSSLVGSSRDPPRKWTSNGRCKQLGNDGEILSREKDKRLVICQKHSLFSLRIKRRRSHIPEVYPISV